MQQQIESFVGCKPRLYRLAYTDLTRLSKILDAPSAAKMAYALGAEIAQALEERAKSRRLRPCTRIEREEAEPRDLLGLLRVRRQRPRRRRAAKNCDELPTAAHSITSSAR